MGKKLTTNEYVEKAAQKHNNKYDYSKSVYITNKVKICIICPGHGEFFQEAKAHLKGCGCPKCSIKHKKTTNEFINEAKKVHGNKYVYSKTEYTNALNQICIICPVHGEFFQEANTHLRGCGCPKCSGTYMDKEFFITKSKQIHENKYDYSKVNYINNATKVCLICPKHGEFWQSPNKHMQSCGCPRCNESKLEREIRRLLVQNSITFKSQAKHQWLGRQSLDFYLPDHKIAIECQGKQHFKPVSCFGGNVNFKPGVKRDEIKYNLCCKNDVKLLYFSTEKNIDFTNYIDKVYTDELELINEIKTCNKS